MTRDAPPLPRLDLGLADLAPRFDVVLCDVWGVIHNGVRHHRAAVEALCRYRAGGGTVVLVTNAPAPKAGVARRLAALAVPPEAYDDIATSGDVTIDLIVEAGCPPIRNIGPAGEIALYTEAGRRGPRVPPRVAAEDAALVVCIAPDATGERPEDYDGLLARLKARDLAMICANPDILVEMGDRLEYCAGAIAARYVEIGGRVVQAGKPFAAIYERALAMAAAKRGRPTPPARVLAIGDAIHTDMAGAADQGFGALFVTGGIHRAALHPAGSAMDRTVLSQMLASLRGRPLAALPQLGWTLAP